MKITYCCLISGPNPTTFTVVRCRLHFKDGKPDHIHCDSSAEWQRVAVYQLRCHEHNPTTCLQLAQRHATPEYPAFDFPNEWAASLLAPEAPRER